MKTLSCHRKYPITTNFLDTMLEHSVVIEEGETKLDAYRRGLRELDQIAAELRREANPGDAEEYAANKIQQLKQEGRIRPAEPIPIISKDKERIEIAIDNASDLASLARYKKDATKMGLVKEYMRRINELNLNANQTPQP
jgi:hypothetical protein